MATEQKPTSAKYWADACANSRNGMVILPDEFKSVADEIQAKRQELQKLNIALDRLASNFWSDLRLALHEKQIPGALDKTLGWNADALEAGFYVVNLRNPDRGQGGLM